jgi:hypothetical protein
MKEEKRLYNIVGISDTVAWSDKYGNKFDGKRPGSQYIGEVISEWFTGTESQLVERLSQLHSQHGNDFDVHHID